VEATAFEIGFSKFQYRQTSRMDNDPYVRPATPQALLHRAPEKLGTTADSVLSKPDKYIILLLAPAFVPRKVEIAKLVSQSLSCPFYQGDSLHDSSSKAAAVGASRSDDSGKGRYQRMWLRKLTRTGLLFPEESRPATEGFSGFGGGSSSTSTSRKGSVSSISSTTSVSGDSAVGPAAPSAVDIGNKFIIPGGILSANQYVNHPVFTISEAERSRKSNPALMVLTHPSLEAWHKDAIREATREYGIGTIFVHLGKTDIVDGEEKEEEELPVLKPLDPRTISGFASFDALRAAAADVGGENNLKYGKGKKGNVDDLMLSVDVTGSIEKVAEEIVREVRDIMVA
jgi:hypothetical protein